MLFSLIIPTAVWVGSFILSAFSLLTGAAAYFIISHRLLSSQQYILSNLIDVILGRESVYFLINDLQVNEFIRRNKTGLLTSAVTFLFFFLMYLLDIHNKFLLLFISGNSNPNEFSFLELSISIFLIGSALYSFSPDAKLNQRLCSKLNRTIRNLQADSEEVRKLKRIIPQIRKCAGSLNIFFPINYINEIQKEIKNKVSSISVDVSLVKNIINDKIEQAASDKTELEKATRVYSAFLKYYNKVSVNVLKTNSISHINQLNHLTELMEENKTQLLTNRKWKDFQSTSNDFLLALDELNGLALRYLYDSHAEDDLAENDPYALLEAEKDMTDEEIRRKWKKLLEEYHPDRADNTTEGIRRLVTERAQAINNAFNRIKKERNMG